MDTHSLSRIAVTVLASVVLSACTQAWQRPEAPESVDLSSREQTVSRDDVTVSVAVPDQSETYRLFGAALYEDGIQPVRVTVSNESDREYVLMKVGMDPQHFSPLEAAYQQRGGDKEAKRTRDLYFYRSAFQNPVAAGSTQSGYVFTSLDKGFKAINIDLVSSGSLLNFSFTVPVPGLITDVSQVDLDAMYDEFTPLDEPAELLSRLDELPCCTTNKQGDKNGDPLNIVFIGERSHILSALIRRGWDQTEITYGRSAAKTVKSFLFGGRYRYSPISPLYVFDRSQDIGLQKARDSINLRNHMRLWLAPFTYKGMEVYIGQISRDIGVKLNKRTITTHAIDPNIDETRDSLIGDLAYSQFLQAFGYAPGSQASTLAEPAFNLTPDPYYSDGLRAVMFFTDTARPLDEIEILNWEKADPQALTRD